MVVGFYRLDAKSSEEAARRNMVANGVSDVDPAHGAHAAVMKATKSAVPKHPMQNLWHAIEPKFLAEDVASVSQDRRRGAGSTQVSLAAVMAPCVWLTSPPAPPLVPRTAPSRALVFYELGLHHSPHQATSILRARTLDCRMIECR